MIEDKLKFGSHVESKRTSMAIKAFSKIMSNISAIVSSYDI